MKSLDRGDKKNSKTGAAEIRLRGRPVSRGVSIGKVVCLYGENRQFYRTEISKAKIGAEVDRFERAFDLARRQLKKLGSSASVKAATSGIFEAHLAILESPSLKEQIRKIIEKDRVNAEWAVKLVTDSYLAKYKAITDEHLRERYIDIQDVAERLHTALGGEKISIDLDKNSVVAAKDLRPSTLVGFSDSMPKGIITENGGWTSHTFILAREVHVPAVTGLDKVLRHARTGDTVIVDGYSGQVILHPTDEMLSKYRLEAAQFEQLNYNDLNAASDSIKTLDGREIVIRANFDIPASFRKAKRLGARGIGLYRSEFLFNQYKGFPDEVEQVKAYREIAAYAGESGARIRTFDLGAEQLLDHQFVRERNPALGLRAIRLGLAGQKELRVQLRALLQASVEKSIDIILPMVTGVGEIRAVRSLIKKESRNLSAKGIAIGKPRLGAMIEVPSAVLSVKHILEEVDSLCLGTNDLVQYLLAVDRDNESVSGWFRTLHPAVIKALSEVISAAAAAGKPVVVCGEMAGSPFYVPILVGLGATELSMNVNSIPRVRKVIEGIAYEETRELASAIAESRTAEETESITTEIIQKRWIHLFPPDLLKPGKA